MDILKKSSRNSTLLENDVETIFSLLYRYNLALFEPNLSDEYDAFSAYFKGVLISYVPLHACSPDGNIAVHLNLNRKEAIGVPFIFNSLFYVTQIDKVDWKFNHQYVHLYGDENEYEAWLSTAKFEKLPLSFVENPFGELVAPFIRFFHNYLE